MAAEVIVPKLGLTMTEATLVKWRFEAGQAVKKDDIVYELETDKVTSEVPAPADGLLLPLVAAGEKVLVSQVVGYLAVDQAEFETLSKDHPAEAGGQASAADQAAPAAAAAPAPAETAPAAEKPAADGRLKASPVARAMAAKHGLDLAALKGSGPGGRIVKADVQKALDSAAAAPAPAAPPAGVDQAGTMLTPAKEMPISGVRKIVFDNMHLSLSSQAQLTLHTEASALKFKELRADMNAGLAAQGTKVSYNAILVKAAALALRRHPEINASVSGQVIKVWNEINIGLAMDLGKGLVVPKVRSADMKTVAEISVELDKLVESIKSGAMSPDDLAGGTFTITSLGAWDIDHFTPIVNNPESAILGVGRILDKPWVRDGQVVAEPRMALSLTIDHRIIDGAPGAAFLKTIKDMIETPVLMI